MSNQANIELLETIFEEVQEAFPYYDEEKQIEIANNILGDGTVMELFILIGGAYALYTVGMAIATELDYRAVNRRRK